MQRASDLNQLISYWGKLFRAQPIAEQDLEAKENLLIGYQVNPIISSAT
jgi:hypothetical protein